MARCGCASTCSCLVVAGDHVTVTGNGSLANPYVVTADALNVLDEGGLLSSDVIQMDFQGAGVNAALVGGEVVVTIPGYSDEQARDAIGAALVAGGGISIVVNDAGDSITISSTVSGGDDDETVRDVIGAALRAGTGIVITIDDVGDTITISSSGAGVQSTVGAGLPTFVGRSVGDFHRNVTDGREYVLTGSSGVGDATDTFTRANGGLNGSTTETGALTWVSSTNPATISGNAILMSAGSTSRATVDTGISTGALTVSADLTPTMTNGFVQLWARKTLPAGDNGYTFEIDRAAGTSVLKNGTTGATLLSLGAQPATKANYSVSLSGVTAPVTVTIKRDGVTLGSYVDNSPPTFGNLVGFNGAPSVGTCTLDNFAVQASSNTIAWTQETEPASPTLRSLGAPQITQGAGLAPFTGRVINDLHYDNTSGKMHILTGAAGTSFSDDFNRADAGTLGGSYATTGANSIVSNRAVLSGTARVALTSGPQSAEATVIAVGSGSAQVSINGNNDNFGGYLLNMYLPSGGTAYLQIRNGYDGTLVFDASAGIPYVAGRAYKLGIYRDSTNIYFYIIDTVTGAANSLSMTIASAGTALNGAYAMLSTGTVDEWTAFAIGTLAWTYDEPLYLSCVVPGAVTVGTHVFKPGLRVPTGPTVARRLVIRTDTPATAGGITVVAHRYNNGIDTGDTITATIASGANVGSTTAAVGTASGDMWKFDVTVANGGSDLLINLDCF